MWSWRAGGLFQTKPGRRGVRGAGWLPAQGRRDGLAPRLRRQPSPHRFHIKPLRSAGDRRPPRGPLRPDRPRAALSAGEPAGAGGARRGPPCPRRRARMAAGAAGLARVAARRARGGGPGAFGPARRPRTRATRAPRRSRPVGSRASTGSPARPTSSCRSAAAWRRRSRLWAPAGCAAKVRCGGTEVPSAEALGRFLARLPRRGRPVQGDRGPAPSARGRRGGTASST